MMRMADLINIARRIPKQLIALHNCKQSENKKQEDNRRQMVKLNGMFSDSEIVNHGVPQGTVLGPLIFLLYVKDFSSNINTTEKLIQFADDISIVCCGPKSSLHGKVTEILQKTEEYVEMNKLTLNTKPE